MTNKVDRREYYRQYRQRHKNDEAYLIKERTRIARYRQSHKDDEAYLAKNRIRAAKYRQLNKTDRLEYFRRYRRLHKDDEAYLAKDRARAAKNRRLNKDSEKHKLNRHIISIKYGRSSKGLEKSRERGRRYRQNHPGIEASRVALRKAIIKGAKSEKFTKQEIYERDGGRCHLCGKKCNHSKWHLDHLIPLSLGGEHTRKNVAVACPRCNESKGNKGHSQLRLLG